MCRRRHLLSKTSHETRGGGGRKKKGEKRRNMNRGDSDDDDDRNDGKSGLRQRKVAERRIDRYHLLTGTNVSAGGARAMMETWKRNVVIHRSRLPNG